MTQPTTPERTEHLHVLRLLTRPPVRGLLTIAFLARTTSAVLPITLLLALAQSHGYTRAALVSGGYTFVIAFCAPLRGRLLDRFGAHRMLTVMGTVTALFLGLVACSIEFRWPWWTTLPLVIAATLSSPPLNAALRSSWRRLATGEAQLKAVHSADSVLEEAGFVLAPLAAGVTIALLGPRHAYEAAAACFITVTVLYLAAARRHQLGTTRATPSSNTSRPGRDGRRSRRWLGALAVPGMTAILLPLLVMGCVFGGTSVLVPAYIQHQHATFWLGPLLAATSIGGVIGGILYATTGWKAGLWRKYHLLTLGFTLPATLLFLARPLWLLASLLFLAGLFVTPLFINAFLLIDATTTDDTRVEANTWVGASTDIPNGIMAVIIGTLAEHHRWDTALLTLTCCAAAGATGALLASAHRPQPPVTAAVQRAAPAPEPRAPRTPGPPGHRPSASEAAAPAADAGP
ncbi:MFS transporter [Streptomyces anulatus]|uniref:MFS transporter n=1 Tax=Streptomyces anulatus TaxID=1892 RepID=A0ABZ1ZWR4_STRAQ|nr:MFS transporter [Streptomyces anulatus]